MSRVVEQGLGQVRSGGTRAFRVAFYHAYVAFSLGAAAVILIPQDQNGVNGSNAVFTGAWVVMQAVAVLCFFTIRNHDPRGMLVALGIGVYIISSSIWSAAPAVTLVYSGMIAVNIVAAYMVSRDMSMNEVLRMVVRVVAVLAIAGMIASFLGVTQVRYYDAHGRPNLLGGSPIRGFFPHKIMASLFVSIGAIAALHVYRGWRRLGLIGAFALFVVQTSSATGLILFPFAIVLYPLLFLLRAWRVSGPGVTVVAASVLVPFTTYVLANFNALLEVLGRDESLTGRTYLWDWGIRTWARRPFFGWGFNGYLNGPEARKINEVYPQLGNYEVPHFHHSVIQTAVDLGAVGVAIVGIVIVSIVTRGFGMLRWGASTEGVALLAILLTLLVASLTMFLFLQYNHFATFFLFVTYFALPVRARLRRSEIHEGGWARV